MFTVPLKIKVKPLQGLCLLAAMCTPAAAHAQNKYHRFDWHGFIAQGVMDSHDSSFANLEGETSAKLTEVGFNASYDINHALRLAGQVIYLNGDNRYVEGARVDYLFLDWAAYEDICWKLDINLGKYKNNHWLYSSAWDVPHTRPSIMLPQSVYFDVMRDATLAIEGVGVSLSHIAELGTLTFSFSAGKGDIDESTQLVMSSQAEGKLELDKSFITSIRFIPDSERWLVNISYLDSNIDYNAAENDVFRDGKIEVERYIGSLMYSANRWELTAELIQEKSVTHELINNRESFSQTSQGGYLQSRFFAAKDLVLLARFDLFDRNKDDRSGAQLSAASGGVLPTHLGYMDDVTIGVEWGIQQNLRLQAEFHRIHGTGRLGPTLTPNININQSEYWNFWAVQLMYWF